MRFFETRHNNGDVSIRLVPETPEEKAQLNGMLSGKHPGIPKQTGTARLDAPVLTKGGDIWGEWSVGSADDTNPFTRKLTMVAE